MKISLIFIGKYVSSTISMDCDIIECPTNTNPMEETQNWFTLKTLLKYHLEGDNSRNLEYQFIPNFMQSPFIIFIQHLKIHGLFSGVSLAVLPHIFIWKPLFAMSAGPQCTVLTAFFRDRSTCRLLSQQLTESFIVI